jgi:hypothetical protein
MTSRLRAICYRVFGAACAFTMLLGVPAPADAQWGKLEKLSGAGDWQGVIYEFRVVCFGEKSRASDLTDEAESLSTRARALEKSGDPEERKRVISAAATKWAEAADAWAQELGEDPGSADENEVRRTARRGRAMLTATSSAGVLWSLCRPDRPRRLSIDIGWSTWDADPDPGYAGGAPINLDTLMGLVSWRLLADTNYDFVELSAGGGMYWFSSTGFKSLRGVVLQPARLTLRAPSSWSGKPLNDWRRWAAIPVYGIGVTMFPLGFEPNDFAGVGDKAVRIPRELLKTQYFFVNVEPFLRMFGK